MNTQKQGQVILIQDLQYKNADTIDQRNDKDTFCGFILVGIDIDGKQNNISQQAQGTHRSDHPVIIHEVGKKIHERISRELDEINNYKTEQRADQSKR